MCQFRCFGIRGGIPKVVLEHNPGEFKVPHKCKIPHKYRQHRDHGPKRKTLYPCCCWCSYPDPPPHHHHSPPPSCSSRDPQPGAVLSCQRLLQHSQLQWGRKSRQCRLQSKGEEPEDHGVSSGLERAKRELGHLHISCNYPLLTAALLKFLALFTQHFLEVLLMETFSELRTSRRCRIWSLENTRADHTGLLSTHVKVGLSWGCSAVKGWIYSMYPKGRS